MLRHIWGKLPCSANCPSHVSALHIRRKICLMIRHDWNNLPCSVPRVGVWEESRDGESEVVTGTDLGEGNVDISSVLTMFICFICCICLLYMLCILYMLRMLYCPSRVSPLDMKLNTLNAETQLGKALFGKLPQSCLSITYNKKNRFDDETRR